VSAPVSDAAAVEIVSLGRPRDLWFRVAIATAFVVLQLVPILILLGALLQLEATTIAACIATVLVVVAMLAAQHFGPAQLALGADGLSVRRVGASEFVAWGALRAVRIDRGDLVIERRGRRPLRCWFSRLDDAEGEALAARLNQAASEARARPFEAAAVFLDRGDRGLYGWIDALRQLSVGGVYRHAGPDRALIERILEAPSTPPARRVAAALVLEGSGEETARSRVRIVAEASVDPTMREALEGVLSGAPAKACLEHVEPGLRRQRGVKA